MKYVLMALVMVLAVGCSHSKNKGDAGKAGSNTAAAAKHDSKEGMDTSVVCKKGTDERTINIVANGPGCVVSYTKLGKEQKMANQANGTSHCVSSRDKIKKNLTAAGFSCK